MKMKIAISTQRGGLEDDVSSVFGRCQKITFAECEVEQVKETKVTDNPGFSAAGGAGIVAAQYVADEKTDAVVSGNFGPNSARVLAASGIKMIQYSGKAGEAVKKYVKGEIKPLDGATVSDHFGSARQGPGRRGRARGGGRW